MGDVSVIARRLEDGNVQYGWAGNEGYYRSLGAKLIYWYDDPSLVNYLFGLGQMRWIGRPGSERFDRQSFAKNEPAGLPHWTGVSECEIFSRIAFVDYGYFYDTDQRWYYVKPGVFRIKVPLAYIANHVDEYGNEYMEFQSIEKKLAAYLLQDYYAQDDVFGELIRKNYPKGATAIYEDIMSGEDEDYVFPCYNLYEKYNTLFEYFDDWIVAVPTDENTAIERFKVHKKQPDKRIETIDWP